MTDLLTAEDLAIPDLPVHGSVPGEVSFTYSHPGQSAFRRALIRAVEGANGQPMLRRLYLDWRANPREGETVFAAALRLLRLELRLQGAAIAGVPREGGLLLVANHPFGIVDGLMIGHLGMQLRRNVRILTNSLLCRPPELARHLLPVDFSGTAEARRLSGETRRRAAQALAMGEAVAIFPGGGVATANRPVTGRAVDSAWHPFAGRLAVLPGVTTLPLHFSGQNSRLFQIASHLSYAMRVALIFHETRRLMGRRVAVTVGEPLSAAALATLPRAEVTDVLRRRTMELAGGGGDPDEVFVWPAHIRW
ncbi:MAG: 1-acyl-sn-glycerol-3-phosphate acyltransferase [Rhodobacteraceae bacterium]|nr:1-acyl-sn-glycerol-3-phosphate acyltransferase [Paracoccaceae bacterium]